MTLMKSRGSLATPLLPSAREEGLINDIDEGQRGGDQQTPASCASGGPLKRIWVHNLPAKGANSLPESSFSFANSPQLAILRSVHQSFTEGKEVSFTLRENVLCHNIYYLYCLTKTASHLFSKVCSSKVICCYKQKELSLSQQCHC